MERRSFFGWVAGVVASLMPGISILSKETKDKEPLSVIAAIGGARSGKTTLGAHKIVRDGIDQVGYSQEDINAGLPYICIVSAPSYAMLRRIVVPHVISKIPKELIIGKYHETRKWLIIKGAKGLTHFYFIYSKDIDGWQGIRAHRVWIDEFYNFKKEEFEEVSTYNPLKEKKRCREPVYDQVWNVLKDKGMSLFLTGTAEGINDRTDVYEVIKESRWRYINCKGSDARTLMGIDLYKLSEKPYLHEPFLKGLPEDETQVLLRLGGRSDGISIPKLESFR